MSCIMSEIGDHHQYIRIQTSIFSDEQINVAMVVVIVAIFK